jgi:hypothetical protein
MSTLLLLLVVVVVNTIVKTTKNVRIKDIELVHWGEGGKVEYGTVDSKTRKKDKKTCTERGKLKNENI